MLAEGARDWLHQPVHKHSMAIFPPNSIVPFTAPLTVLHHEREELDQHLGGGAQQHLLLAALLGIVHSFLRRRRGWE